MPSAFIAKTLTLLAKTVALLAAKGIVRGKRMAIFTMGFSSIKSGGSIASKDVYMGRNKLHVNWVATACSSA